MQLLSFRFKFEDENLVVRKDFVTINKTRYKRNDYQNKNLDYS